jgi:KDO2-lipid IV(A) lauroyltransferase
MAKKSRNRTADFAVYLVVRGLVCVLQALPLRVALGFGRVLALVAYRVDKRHREVARDNLRHAFPERCSNPVECDRLVRACYTHFCTMAIEIALLPRRMHLHNWRSFGTPTHFERIVVPVLGDRPVLLVTAHYGNWEVAGYVTGVVGLTSYAIARDLDNPYLDRFLRKFRQKTGQTILSKENDYDRITAVLASGGIVATLGDQDAGPKGMFVDFFRRPASTHKAVALLAMSHDALMVVLGVPRVGTPMRYELNIEEVIDPRDHADRPDAARAITERFTRAIERLVRRHPEQYFWLHRRWKHQPPVRKSRLDTAAA